MVPPESPSKRIGLGGATKAAAPVLDEAAAAAAAAVFSLACILTQAPAPRQGRTRLGPRPQQRR